MHINRCYSLFFLVLSGDSSETFCEVRRTHELLWRNKRERDMEGGEREQILKTEPRQCYVFSPAKNKTNNR